MQGVFIPIAIVGMSMRLPGGVRTEDQFRDTLIKKGDGLCEVPKSRYTVESFYHPSKGGCVKTKNGYFLQDDPGYFDAPFFSVRDYEAACMDPQQRLLLELVWECLENAGETDWEGKEIGCYVGVFGEDWLSLAPRDPQTVNRFHAIGTGDYALANSISYKYDFRGPSMTIQTGCSSSLIAIHEACQSLAIGACSSAIVAGSSLILTPTMTASLFSDMVLSPSGVCRTFDANADGYGCGEAINAVYLKRLDHAIQANDPIRAVIRSTAVNFDGRKTNMTAPSIPSQESLLRSAYRRAGIDDPLETAFVECHGTGTVAGDKVEITALSNFLQPRGVVIGAVKPNFGHSEGASGITSLIKATLSLERTIIPPNAHIETLIPGIPKASFIVPLEPMNWPADRRQRVGINGFGVGGANVHVILDSASEFCRRYPATQPSFLVERTKLLVISARDPKSLKARIQQVTDYVNINPHKLHDLSFTLGVRREHLSHRAFCISSRNVLLESTNFQRALAKKSPQLSFTYDEFRADMLALEENLKSIEDSPSWSLQAELYRMTESRVNEAEFCQPLYTAVQIGLVNLFASWGIRPAAVVGHSSGEIAAAYVAGAISAKSAIILAYYRGKLAYSQKGYGGMASIGLSTEDVAQYLLDGVVIACKNSPKSVTLSGERGQIDLIVERIKAELPDTFCRKLDLDVAYHSHYMKALGSVYEDSISRHLKVSHQMLPMFSSVTTRVVKDPSELNSVYWQRNLESPVLFNDAINNLLGRYSHHILLEIGPHSALSGPLKQIFNNHGLKQTPVYVPTLIRYDTNCAAQLLSAIGHLHINGAFTNLTEVNGQGRPLTDLPPYPWQHGMRYWNEGRLVRDWRLSKAPYHELLGLRCTESTDLQPTWRNILRLGSVTWLSEHLVRGQVMFPGAGYIAMAGEVRQLSPNSEGYSVKGVNDLMSSEWFSFAIATYNANEWTENCSGHVRVGFEQQPGPMKVENYARRVSSVKWYHTLSSLGLSYGAQFRGLQDISADPRGGRAPARVNGMQQHESLYRIHPTVIDQCLQLMSVAGAAGIPRRIIKNVLPASIREMVIVGGDHMDVNLTVKEESGNSMVANATAMLDEQVMLSMTHGMLFSMGGENTRPMPLMAQIQWRPDLEFQDPHSLLPQSQLSEFEKRLLGMVNQITFLYIIQTANKIRHIQPEAPHLAKWKSCLVAEATKMSKYNEELDPDFRTWLDMFSDEKDVLIKELASKMINQEDDTKLSTMCMDVIYVNSQDIMANKVSPLDVLMADNRLGRYFAFPQKYVDWSIFLTLLCHSKPAMHVLEIGGGTGGATEAALQSLCASGVPMYANYVFTDIAPIFLTGARNKFECYGNMEYKTLDISRDPLEQGFAAHTFDLIIASNVLHATLSLKQSLDNVKKLLAPTGRLLFQELYSELLCTDYILGTLPGWWIGEKDGRVNRPYISSEKWDEKLQSAGFTGAEATSYDFEAPYRSSATMVTRLLPSPFMQQTISLLIADPRSPSIWAKAVHSELTGLGHAMGWTTLTDSPTDSNSIIFLLDQEEPWFYGMSEQKYQALKTYLTQANNSLLIWNPDFGLTHGFVRSVRQEMVLDFCMLEVESSDIDAAKALGDILQKVTISRKRSDPNLDYEFDFHSNTIYSGRCEWVLEGQKPLTEPKLELPKRIHVRRSGQLDSLTWLEVDEEDLRDTDVDIEIHYVGLNFRDVLVAMGYVGNTHEVGLEACGIVQRVGNHVTDLVSGDKVLVFNPGALRTRMVVNRKLCRKLPKGLPLEDGANIALVYVTVIYSLVYHGQIKKDQTVLIHSACGGVGLAAIQVCKLFGAEIYATVGNETKRDHLVNSLGIPPTHIFDSRNASFLPSLMEATGGRGVDIVLNSHAGNLLHASWACVAPFGRMIELGKRDFILNGILELKPFLDNRSFFGVDLLEPGKAETEEFGRAITQLMEWYEEGKIQPIRPVTMFEACDGVEAFRYMQKGTHIGKIKSVSFSSNASYLLVGGLGGVGRAVSTWMVERGAPHLTYLSQSAGASDDDVRFINELEVMGCHVQCVKGSVTSIKDIKRAVSECKKPLKGVLQIHYDGPFLERSYEDWQMSIASKVQGTWNLHNSVTQESLDFFVLFESVIGLCGNANQTNYAAANTFCDAFTRYRRQLGLPSSTLVLGGIGEMGLISRQPKLLQTMRAVGVWLLGEEEVLEGLEMCIPHSHSPRPSEPRVQTSAPLIVGLGYVKPISDPAVRPLWDKDFRQGSEEVSGNLLRDLVSRAEQDPSIVLLKESGDLVMKETTRLLKKLLSVSEDLDEEQQLEVVIDSLASIEIRSWVRRNLGFEVTLAEIAKARTIEGLAQFTTDRLRAHFMAKMENSAGADEEVPAKVSD
ncbi:putative polyketide synthase [Aspergillus ellipticus CBS 707.79]|uniref:Putative polyketide synthase n=1 Tax=Aspergillus ellipticus CBS 707.79 TaxID=1448320 RepID=A0A319F0A1_9EURO|nr:putative polyketide synthase [Aspergillus ellipticus CBS 707.79]